MDETKGTYAYNYYLQMVAEIGLVGLMSFLWNEKIGSTNLLSKFTGKSCV